MVTLLFVPLIMSMIIIQGKKATNDKGVCRQKLTASCVYVRPLFEVSTLASITKVVLLLHIFEMRSRREMNFHFTRHCRWSSDYILASVLFFMKWLADLATNPLVTVPSTARTILDELTQMFCSLFL